MLHFGFLANLKEAWPARLKVKQIESLNETLLNSLLKQMSNRKFVRGALDTLLEQIMQKSKIKIFKV